MRAGMLVVAGEALAFRHELARRAVHEAMSPLRRRELHAAGLEVLKSREQVRAAEIAHHAQQAGAAQDLVVYSRRAAHEADALGAHRESVAHLARVLEHGAWLTNAERAEVLQRQAEAGEVTSVIDSDVCVDVRARILYRRVVGDETRNVVIRSRSPVYCTWASEFMQAHTCPSPHRGGDWDKCGLTSSLSLSQSMCKLGQGYIVAVLDIHVSIVEFFVLMRYAALGQAAGHQPRPKVQSILISAATIHE